jgi:hypothetical protein
MEDRDARAGHGSSRPAVAGAAASSRAGRAGHDRAALSPVTAPGQAKAEAAINQHRNLKSAVQTLVARSAVGALPEASLLLPAAPGAGIARASQPPRPGLSGGDTAAIVAHPLLWGAAAAGRVLDGSGAALIAAAARSGAIPPLLLAAHADVSMPASSLYADIRCTQPLALLDLAGWAATPALLTELATTHAAVVTALLLGGAPDGDGLLPALRAFPAYSGCRCGTPRG